METLQELVKSFVTSADFSILDEREGFLVADKLGLGGSRETWLLWILPASTEISDFAALERTVLDDCEAVTPNYPDGRYFIVCHSLEGLSRDFRAEAKRLRLAIRVPAQFFDAPFKIEEAPEAASTISRLRKSEENQVRAPQPYSILVGSSYEEAGDDLLSDLFEDMRRGDTPCLRIILAPAGGGKSVLYASLFARLYGHFIREKARQKVFPRPIPFMPEYLRQASALRTDQLIDTFLRTDVASPVSRRTFEWMLVHGFGTWMFDGLDELYAGDPDFLDCVLELLTQGESKAQVFVCARHSLMRTCDSLADFLHEFPADRTGMVRVYRLDDWRHRSKRALAFARIEGHLPKKDEEDSHSVAQFLHAVEGSEGLKQLSAVPYYCALLLDRFVEGSTTTFSDDLELMEESVRAIIDREMRKGLLRPDYFERGGLADWMETLAWDAHEGGFKGLPRAEVEEYARLVVRTDLPEGALENAITSMVQFPLFEPGLQPGTLAFKHELVAEYLASRFFLKEVSRNAAWLARALGTRVDLGESLLARGIAAGLTADEQKADIVAHTMKYAALSGRQFANLLEILLLATPRRDSIQKYGISLEGRNLHMVRFTDKDLRNVSFRGSDLTSVSFVNCDLANAKFEGAQLVGTRFEGLSAEALRGASFGDLGHFQCIYHNRRRIDDLGAASAWVSEVTGRPQEVKQPCATALQLRTLLLKYLRPDGSPRRHQLRHDALTRGRQHERAATPEECIDACQRFGYLDTADYRGRIGRVGGDKWDEIVLFIRDWEVSPGIRQMLNTICNTRACRHVPEDVSSA